ncbi:diguanylate cyclase [[Limnothrix rosea] IAM M-220]|uniref:sensor domain-containing diguanylate cyclase n=1 Tax=[Limnothrix rosea] IAM M-220 TaxID=454133 RepID=UPI0009684255|nr:diguanylate cyclase [[Limnothrix rosea] IAM M-220]OKH14173.1 hypothetical protein NIES208_14445 [[Limnothrix rosea] IAM M-220]
MLFWLPKHPFFYQLAIAIGYVCAIRISSNFASLPGELTALWLPAVLGLIVVLKIGRPALIGIAIGTAFDSYFALSHLFPDFSLWAIASLTVGITLSEGISPLMCATWLQQRHKNITAIFQTTKGIFEFLGISLFSNSISAIIPVLTFHWFGIITSEKLVISWLVWFLGASLAQLIFVPPIILWQSSHIKKDSLLNREVILFLSLLTSISYLVFYQGYSLEYLFLPLLISSVFRLEQPLPQIFVVLLSAIGIIATANNYGSFVKDSPHESLLFLESFVAAYSITVLIISAILHEKESVSQKLNATLDFLEERVFDRTAKLLQTQLILDTFIDTAPLGMAIIDKNLNFVKINNFLADIEQNQNTFQTVHHNDLHPAIRHEITSKCRTILEKTQATLREEVYFPSLNSGSTWLMSYFPIIDEQGNIFRVGFIGLDISDRKQLELILQKQAQLDGLTKIANRRKFDEVLEREWRRCRRDNAPLSLLLFDIDQFKVYNDTYGHVQGDECLIQIAQVLKKQIGRTTDLAARYGGEEFIVLLSNTNSMGACHIANTILDSIRQLKIPHKNSSVMPFVTSSCGVATCIPSDQSKMIHLVNLADQALYQAKSQGRNQMIVIELETKCETA